MLCCYAIEPPLVNSNSFNEVNTSEIILLVPDISIEKYKNDAVWGGFLIDTETSILSSSCKTKEKLPNYNLNGYSLTESTKGY